MDKLSKAVRPSQHSRKGTAAFSDLIVEKYQNCRRNYVYFDII